MLFCFIVKPSNHLVAMTTVEFKIRAFVESLSMLSPKRRVLVLNLCSQRWFKPRRKLVISLISFGL